MLLTNIAILNYDSVFNILSQIDCPSKVSYWCFKNRKMLNSHISCFYETRARLFEKYLYKDTDGKYFKTIENDTPMFNIQEGKKCEFEKELDDLMNIEIEVDPYLLDLENVVETHPNWSFKPIYFEQLHDFIKD